MREKLEGMIDGIFDLLWLYSDDKSPYSQGCDLSSGHIWPYESWTIKKAEHQRIDAFKLWWWRRLLRALGLQGNQASQSYRILSLNIQWKNWCWRWVSNTLATWCKELTYWNWPWCWERLRAGGEGDDRGWDGWMASLTQRTWVWASSGSWWQSGKPGVLQSMKLQRIEHDWTEQIFYSVDIRKWFGQVLNISVIYLELTERLIFIIPSRIKN